MFVARIGARAALVAVVCAVGLLAGVGSALAEEAKFTYTGKEQEFEVPAGVTSVEVVAVGSQGESAAGLGGAGGVGAIVAGKLTVKPEQALYVEVGGVPFNGGGASEHGGKGGGASDVRTVSIGAEPSPGNEASLNSRLLVAAGGGGGGLEDFLERHQCAGGAGGAAEEKGANGTSCGFTGGEGGGAGEANKGGAGGTGYAETTPSGEFEGKPGQLGVGGGAGGGGGDKRFPGGGGGGRYGGGGGGEQEVDEGEIPISAGEGGGGGGSNLVPVGGSHALAAAGQAASVKFTPVVIHPTKTSVKCSPASLVAGGSTTCTATVKDEATSEATTPTGNVAFKTGGSGSFNEASCALAGSGATASCEVTYKPTSTPTKPERTDTITAKYEGDEAHEGSKGTTTVTVISYSQTISGSVGGNLVVQAGQSVLLSSKARIEGNVTVKPGGALDVEGARIEGVISANKSTRVRMCGARPKMFRRYLFSWQLPVDQPRR